MSSLGLEWRSNKQDKTGNNHKAPYTNSVYNYPRCSSVGVVDVSHFFLPRNSCTGAIQQPALLVFVGDHRQTPGGLSKGRAAAANRQKLLQRPLGLRALNRPGDYLPPARLASLVGRLWPDASQASDSDIARLLQLGKAPHLCGLQRRHRNCHFHCYASWTNGHLARLMSAAASLPQFLLPW